MPGQAMTVPAGWGSQISIQLTCESSKVVSSMHWPPSPPTGNIPGTHFCLRLSQPQGHNATGRVISMKNSSNNTGNLPCDLLAYSAVSQPTVLLHGPRLIFSGLLSWPTHVHRRATFFKLLSLRFVTFRHIPLAYKQEPKHVLGHYMYKTS